MADDYWPHTMSNGGMMEILWRIFDWRTMYEVTQTRTVEPVYNELVAAARV